MGDREWSDLGASVATNPPTGTGMTILRAWFLTVNEDARSVRTSLETGAVVTWLFAFVVTIGAAVLIAHFVEAMRS